MANPNPDKSGLKPPFSKDNQPKNRGRKPSSVKKYIKDNGLNYNDVSAMAKYILPLNQKQITDLLTDEKVPFMVRLFAKSILQDMKKGYLDNIMKIMDRAVGRPREIVDQTSIINSISHTINYTDLPPEEAKKLFFDKISGADNNGD